MYKGCINYVSEGCLAYKQIQGTDESDSHLQASAAVLAFPAVLDLLVRLLAAELVLRPPALVRELVLVLAFVAVPLQQLVLADTFLLVPVCAFPQVVGVHAQLLVGTIRVLSSLDALADCVIHVLSG